MIDPDRCPDCGCLIIFDEDGCLYCPDCAEYEEDEEEEEDEEWDY